MKSLDRVLFLDIDGVLNTAETLGSDRCETYSPSEWVDSKLASTLSQWAAENDVVVVGTSSWFVGCSKEDIAKVGEFLNLPLVDRIGYCGGGHERGLSVLNYVEDKGLTNWSVLDDAGGNMFTYPTVNVNARMGITKFDLMILKIMVDTHTPMWKTLSYRNRQIEAIKSQRR